MGERSFENTMQAAERASPLFDSEQSPSPLGKYNSKNLLCGLLGMGSSLAKNCLCGRAQSPGFKNFKYVKSVF